MRIVTLRYTCSNHKTPVHIHDHAADGGKHMPSMNCPRCGKIMSVSQTSTREHPHAQGVGTYDLDPKATGIPEA